MAAYLWQAFTAEQMNRNGFGRRCYRYEEEWYVLQNRAMRWCGYAVAAASTEPISFSEIELIRPQATRHSHLARSGEWPDEERGQNSCHSPE